MAAQAGKIYVGIGGWNYAPWRGVFYPEGLPQAKELGYAASRLTSIEINATFYGSQKPESFRKWASTVPDGFKFSVKGPRFATNRRVLAEAGDSIKRFVDSGVTRACAIGSGRCSGSSRRPKSSTPPISESFWNCCRRKPMARALRHVVEVRHASFRTPEFVALLRQFNIPVVFTDHATYPSLADVTGDLSMRACNKGKTRSRPLTRRKSSMPGPAACKCGRKARNRTICHVSSRRRRPRRSRRAMFSPTSSTKAKFARRRRRWR